MPQAPHEAALAQMIKRLVALPPEETTAILNKLPVDVRLRAEDKIRDARRPKAAEVTSPTIDTQKLSPWLARIVERGDGLTDTAAEAIRSSASAFFPVAGSVIADDSKAFGKPSLLDRLFSRGAE